MTPREIETLKGKLRRSIARDGIGAVCKRVEVQPSTLLRFLSGAGQSHRGTVRQIAEGLKEK